MRLLLERNRSGSGFWVLLY